MVTEQTMLRERWLSREPVCGCVDMGHRERVQESGWLGPGRGPQVGERMPTASRIMVATDFSAASTGAVERAVGLAKEAGAVLTVLHVIDVNAPTTWGTAGEMMRRLWAKQEVEMARLASRLDGEVEVRVEVEEGLPAEVIVEMSKGYDLLVMGKKAPRGRWNLFARHTAERVAKCAACRVILVEACAPAGVCAAGGR